MATNTNILFARPRLSLEESVADALEGHGPTTRPRAVSLDYGRHRPSLIPRIQVELRDSDTEKQDLVPSLRRLGSGYHHASSNTDDVKDPGTCIHCTGRDLDQLPVTQ